MPSPAATGAAADTQTYAHGTSHAPAGTKIKPQWIEELIDELLDPVGRARRGRAAQKLRDELDVGADD